MATLLSGDFTAKARLPSGVNSTCDTPGLICTVLICVTLVPSIFNTLIVPSARLHTSAMSPFGLNDRPDGCFPTVTVEASFGGLAFMSMTKTLSVGTVFRVPLSSTTVTESAISAMLPLGEMARLVGGPTKEFSSFNVATIFGASGLATSTTSTVSLPVGLTIGLPWASVPPGFLSLPMIMKGAACTTAVQANRVRHAAAQHCNSGDGIVSLPQAFLALQGEWLGS